MGLISAIKSVLGMDDGREGTSGTDVTVEREPDAASERAVKESETPTTEEGNGSGMEGAEPAEPRADLDETPAEPDEPASTGSGEPDSTEAEATGPDEPGEPVEEIKGIGPAYAERLAEAGIETVADLAEADAAELDESTGIGESRIVGWIERAKAR